MRMPCEVVPAVCLDCSGQDVIEYSLIIAFVTILVGVIVIYGFGGSVQGIWTVGNSHLTAANRVSG